MRKIERISISAADRQRLERLARDRNTPQKVVWRTRIVLLASDGLTAEGIAAAVGKSLLTVRRWRRRSVAKGVDGLLKDATRPSRVKPLAAAKIEQVVHMTLHAKPPNATHWSVRSMAAAAGISYSSVQRIWHAHGLKPHLVKTFKVSRDKNFVAKVEDVVGLYLNPPDKALVLCVDEKSQIQALDRTQPGLPMKKGRAGTMTHDYKRNGTTTLFAALEVLQGRVVGQCFERHPRFVCHFVPTSSSWLNLVERWFGELTSKRIRRGSFFSVEDLQKAIEEFLSAWNDNPKPFVWTATVDSIQE